MTGIWKKFVLKGGTSLALFYFPNFRISVDLDYVIYEDRDSYRNLEYYKELLQKIAPHASLPRAFSIPANIISYSISSLKNLR